jgi:hypothetical protein
VSSGLRGACLGRALALGVCLGAWGAGVRVSAQSAGPSSDSGRSAVTFAVEPRDERFDYHFVNDSNFEPGPLVPHSFDQRYDATAPWLVATVQYRVFRAGASTEVGGTPRLMRAGSDIDTFFQPSGDVVTSGTRGRVRLQSFEIRQRFDLATWRLASFGVTLGYRRARADFLPSDRIVTHTRPASETREPVPGHETIWSHVIDSGLTVRLEAPVRGSWHVSAGGDLLPLVRGRLSISLPAKYPGARISADARAFGTAGFVSIERRAGVVAVGGRVTARGVWGYQHETHYHERSVGLAIFTRIGG